jgi:tryptophan synthase beta chain
MKQNAFLLPTDKIPNKWVNILKNFPKAVIPLIDPSTNQPVPLEPLKELFAEELLAQEVNSNDEYIAIPNEVRDIYSIYRPTPLIRAYSLEELLDTPAKIYFKYEGASPSGSHKANASIPQVYFNKREGIKKLTTETGAGKWGTALSFACNKMGVECLIFMVRSSYEQKPYRKIIMQTYGGKVISSPSEDTKIVKELLKNAENNRGSLGMAISEAVELALENKDTHYSLGSVLNHVILEQTVIGEEVRLAFQEIGDYPDILIGACGGGSNFGGFMIPFLKESVEKGKKIRFIGVEPTACPSLTKGKYTWDFGDTGELIPPALMYTLGHTFVPPPNHAGGLRYHGMSPLLSYLKFNNFIEATAVTQIEVFQAATMFAKAEGIIPAPESSHAIAIAIKEALECKKTKEAKTIAFNLSGHGYLDMAAYDDYFNNKLDKNEHPDKEIAEALKKLPNITFKM